MKVNMYISNKKKSSRSSSSPKDNEREILIINSEINISSVATSRGDNHYNFLLKYLHPGPC